MRRKHEKSIDGLVCGIDEVGRGPLAGPVVAAAVYISETCYDLPFISELRDSKKLSETKLTELEALIKQHCVFGIAEISSEEIDQLNILQASLLAMTKAQAVLDGEISKSLSGDAHSSVNSVGINSGKETSARKSVHIDHALIDGNRCPSGLSCPATPVIKGDSVSSSIAAASIIAKTYRDRLMAQLTEIYPHYGWARNVGYPTKEHLSAIDAHGLTPYHRRSFAPVRRFMKFGTTAKAS